jgi:FkbM family methyltransferase
LADSSLQTLLIPSIERYVTKEELDAWDVRLYLGIDHDDVFWLEHHERFEHPSWLTIDRGFYETPNHNVPFNEMMQHAYEDGAEYLVRINDDTEFVTKGWITQGVATLRGFDPPNVGVVGATQTYTHVVFSTFKSNGTGLRSQIESNTRSNLEGLSKRVHTIWFEDDDVEKNVHGTPVLRSMYTQAFSQLPDADTYTYVNGDLLVDGDFVRTADAVVSASKGGHLSRRFLLVGKRTNVDWRGKTTVEDFDAHHSEGTLFWNNAQDYFMVSKHTFDWEKAIPAFVIGRAGYDNWLVDTAFHDPEVALIDATPTIRAIHQTDHEGNVAQGGPNRPDQHYNHKLGKGEWDHGTTDYAELETFWMTDGTVGVRDRQGLIDIGGMTHDMVHRTHLEIFETYCPSVFSASWVDDWITKVYQPGRSRQLKDWEVKHHTGKHGTRYNVQHSEGGLLKEELEKGQKKVAAWLKKRMPRQTLSNDEGNAWIAKKFEEGRPFVVGRLGGAEACLTAQYLKGAKTLKACQNPHRCSGIYPEDPETFERFSSIYWSSLQQLESSDAMATFSNIKSFEEVIFKELRFNTIVKNRAIEPFYFDDPWSKHLRGKIVLIVHGFVPSIQCQLRRATLLFSNPNVLPPFTAKFVHMPQALGGQTPHRSYMHTLSAVKEQIDSAGPFDVAIIAAGAYAMPLAMHCKVKHRATAIAMGGGSQLLFGLKGHRWDTHPILSKLYNAHWMYPLEQDTPDNAKSIEMGGPYWGSKGQRLEKCPIKAAENTNVQEIVVSREIFTITVLTMNRVESLRRLLTSLENAEYGHDRVHLVIRVDHATNNAAVVALAKSFDFSHGEKTVHVATSNNGLRQSWFDAWHPATDESRGIILEDDVEVSPKWYAWLKAAWNTYGDRDDLAGISLQRQTLVPKKPSKQMEIVNEHVPFLYALVGSIGFSPHPKQWTAFLHWVATADLDHVSTPGLVTSDWYAQLDKRHMWTQAFIYFCKSHDLYTLYTNLPHKKTLGAHHREKGEHYGKTEGPDFALAQGVALDFPTELVKYGWDGERREGASTGMYRPPLCMSTPFAGRDGNRMITLANAIRRAKSNHSVVALDTGWSAWYREWFDNRPDVSLDYSGPCGESLTSHDLFYMFSYKTHNSVLPTLIPSKDIRDKAESAYPQRPFVSVHRRNHPSCSIKNGNTLCNNGVYGPACAYTETTVRHIVGETVHIVLFTDGIDPTRDNTFANRDTHSFQQQMWGMVLSERHFGNPLSSMDYVVAHWRKDTAVEPTACFAQLHETTGHSEDASTQEGLVPLQSGRDVVSKPCWEAYQSNVDATKATEFVPGKSVMMEPTSVKMMCELLTPSTRVLEWGSGGSTLFFSKFVKSWDSVEHDAVWIPSMQAFLESRPDLPVTYHPVPVAYDWKRHGIKECPDLTSVACSEPDKCKQCAWFADYVALPQTLGRTYDVVVVDGRARVSCVHAAAPLLAPNGVVVIHDWERPWYKTLLGDWEIVREDKVGPRHLAVLRPKPHKSKHKRCIASSLWMNDVTRSTSYRQNVPLMLKSALRFLAEWHVRIYHDNSVPSPFLDTLKSAHPEVEFVQKPSSMGRSGCFWRFLASKDCDMVVFRDVELEWTADFDVAALRDFEHRPERTAFMQIVHPRAKCLSFETDKYGTCHRKVQAGNYMIKTGDFDMDLAMRAFGDLSEYGRDEWFLSEHVHGHLGPSVVYVDRRQNVIDSIVRSEYNETYVLMPRAFGHLDDEIVDTNGFTELKTTTPGRIRQSDAKKTTRADINLHSLLVPIRTVNGPRNSKTFPLNPKTFVAHVNKCAGVSFDMFVHDPNVCKFISQNLLNGGWECGIMDQVAADMQCGHNEIFMDIGSNIGAFSLTMAKLGHTVFAFEAMQYNIELQQASLGTFLDRKGSVHLFHMAASDESGGEICIHAAPEGNPTHNRGNGQVYIGPCAANDEHITRATINEVVSKYNDVCVRVLKIDIEGYETKALRGASNLFLGECPPCVVYMEYNKLYTIRSGVGANAAFDILKKYGYTCSMIEHADWKCVNILPAQHSRCHCSDQSGNSTQSTMHTHGKPGSSMEATASRIAKDNGFVFLLFLNAAYLEMTKSFICNLRSIHAHDILSHILFIMADEQSASTLLSFAPDAGVFVEKYETPHSVSYGSHAYFRLTVERLRLQRQLIDYGVSVAVIEADATWFQDGARVEDMLRDSLSKHDMVSADDTGNRLISAGFLAISANEKTQAFFGHYVQTYETKLAQHTGSNNIGDVGEQHTMTPLLRKSNLDVMWLDTCNFARGQWYDNTSTYHKGCEEPWVLQNNWIVGNDAKVARAKEWGHWFLEQNGGKCLTLTSKVS